MQGKMEGVKEEGRGKEVQRKRGREEMGIGKRL